MTKSKLLKAGVLATAAIALGALASPVMAKTLTYTFGNASGGAYCDGITLTQATVGHPTWGGTHTGCTNSDPAGGYSVYVNGGANLDIATTDTLTGATQAYTFFLNLKQQYWYLYDTTSGVFAQINSGPLIRGAPPAAKTPGAGKSSTAANPKGRLDQMF
jgi:hypothetical protein